MRYLKALLLKAFDGAARVASFVFAPGLAARAGMFRNKAYSYALGRSFKRVGDDFLVHYPAVIMGAETIEIGSHFTCYARLRLEAYREHLGRAYRPRIVIGDNVAVNYDCHIGCIDRIEIGNNVLIASKVHITDHFHGQIDKDALALPPAARPLQSKGPVVIEDNVWIGEGAVVLPGVRIGRNAIVGANAVVSKDVPADCVVGGVPARVIRRLDAGS